MYASGAPSGTLPGASGTAAKPKRASQPSGQLPVSFQKLPELDYIENALFVSMCFSSADTGNKKNGIEL